MVVVPDAGQTIDQAGGLVVVEQGEQVHQLMISNLSDLVVQWFAGGGAGTLVDPNEVVQPGGYGGGGGWWK